MSDIQAAAERLKRCRNGEDTEDVYGHDCDVSSWGNSAIQMAQQDEDAYRVADAYMAELDPTLVDREWLVDNGFVPEDGNREFWRGVVAVKFSSAVQLLIADEYDFIIASENPTRGQVRTLLRLLG